MIIRKEYKFYAAHRNEELTDKCRNLHGHRYGIVCHFEAERNGSITTLFSDFDARVDPLLKNEYDHAILINIHDPLFATLTEHCKRNGELLRMKVLDRPTSVENLAYQLFGEIVDLGLRLQTLEIQETDTSVCIYTRDDWVADGRLFLQKEHGRTPPVEVAT